MARIAALLSPYFEKDTPQSVRKMEAEDWAACLSVYPQWAIEKAVRWWKSAENDKRRQRPLEGDIEARVKVEMSAVRAAEVYLSSPLTDANEIEAPRNITPETQAHRAKVAADALAGTSFAMPKPQGAAQ